MDQWGIDAEGYIAAVRAGALDPYGQSADELQAALDAFDAELRDRFIAMSPEQVEAGAQPPLLPRAPESSAQERLRLDAEFADRMRVMETRSARVEGERRALLASHMQRVLDLPGDPGPKLKELASFAAVEVGLTTGGLQQQMTLAWTIVTELPAAHQAAAEGRITTAHLRVIESETRAARLDPGVDEGQRARVVEALVAVAEGASTSELRKRAKRIVNEVLSEPLQVRHDTARQQRRVELFDAGDGMSDIVARVPALEGTAILDRLTQAARGKPKDDPRTFDQFRADAFTELMLAGVVPEDLHGVSPIKAHVSILIPATTLLDDDGQDPALRALDFPASLDGKVLVDRDTARRIAGTASVWERLFTDPVTGVAVTVDTYRLQAVQRLWLQARDGSCRFPGCANPVSRADVDHTIDWADGGTTSLGNLGHLCRRDHTLKHDSRWAVKQLPGGVFEWTSPIGQVITTVPEPVGPVFNDLPRSAPTETRAERRRRRQEAVQRLAADRDRVLAGLPSDPDVSPPALPPDPRGIWTTAVDSTDGAPLPF